MMPEHYVPFLTFLGTLAVLVVGFLYNNSRITDLKDLIKSEGARSDHNIARVEGVLAERISRLQTELSKVENELLGRFADLDQRLSRIESHLNLR